MDERPQEGCQETRKAKDGKFYTFDEFVRASGAHSRAVLDSDVALREGESLAHVTRFA